MLEELSSRLKNIVSKILGKATIDEKTIKEFTKEIQKALLLSDVSVKIVLDISRRIEERIRREEPPPGLTIREHMIKVAYEELTKILGESAPEFRIPRNKLTKIMLVGIQGSGKTTTAAKLAKYLSDRGYSVGLLSVDTYRPAGREQLRQLSEIAGVEFFDIPSNNPLEIAEKGLNYYNGKVDVVIIDTAGRHKEEKGLINEMKMLAEYIRPDYIFLVIDASIGQQAYNQAKAFHEATPVGGIIVTKLDGTARGGGALSASAATGAKIYFIGTGEKIEDLEYYDPPSFVSRLMGLGDLKGLLRKLEALKISEEKVRRLKELAKGRFTLEDMIQELESIKKLGGLYKVLSMIPGIALKVDKRKIEELEDKIRKWRVALDSMTLEEKINPKIIKKSRLERISRGSGIDEHTIKEMIKQYEILRKMLKSSRRKNLMKILSRYSNLNRLLDYE